MAIRRETTNPVKGGKNRSRGRRAFRGATQREKPTTRAYPEWLGPRWAGKCCALGKKASSWLCRRQRSAAREPDLASAVRQKWLQPRARPLAVPGRRREAGSSDTNSEQSVAADKTRSS